MKQYLLNYINALDRYREDPNRTNKDHLLEAEWNIRDVLGLPTDHLTTLYRESK